MFTIRYKFGKNMKKKKINKNKQKPREIPK